MKNAEHNDFLTSKKKNMADDIAANTWLWRRRLRSETYRRVQ